MDYYEDELSHYGVGRDEGAPGRGSGRYPKGSGKDPYQHMDRGTWVATAGRLKKDGFTDKEIAEYFCGEGASVSEFQRRLRNAKIDEKEALRAKIIDMHEQGMGASEIGRAIGKSESTVRSMLDPVTKERAERSQKTADVIALEVSDTNYVDIGPGTEGILGVKRSLLQQSVQRLQDHPDYDVLTVYVPQAGVNGANTTMQVVVPNGTTVKDVLTHLERVNPVFGYQSKDDGKTFYGIEEPTNLDSKRLMIRYAEQGGIDKDGTIELRRGVEDISLGGALYAQVRIAVDGTHYIKGMAHYSDDMPDGVDVIFNTNKTIGTPVMGPKNNSVLKPLKDDPNNPFGSALRMEDGVVVGQRKYTDENGVERLSPVNIVRAQGDWDAWSKQLASQFLSKQDTNTAKRQLDLSVKSRQEEFDEIAALTNPEIKKKLLGEFADACDSAAVHLKAAAMPRQATKVLMPLNDLKENEFYCPSLKEGEEVILVRYPHGGIFEIPHGTVNNHSKLGRSILGNGQDVIGINSKVAAQLSGADFDGDTVVAIPTNGKRFRFSDPLDGLKNFEAKEVYAKLPEGYPTVGKPVTKGGDGFNTQNQMGVVSNLITDMTIKGASTDDLARAVRHSMTVIDAEKHQLNWRQSEVDNDVAELRHKYQYNPETGRSGGASTLVSRAKSPVYVNKRREVTDTSKMTPEELEAWNAGKKVYRETGETNYKGEPKKQKSTKMAETDDARTLISTANTEMEQVYANYANTMKAMANSARKLDRETPNSKYDSSAAKVYAEEVASLNGKLNDAMKNKPYERKAQALANSVFAARKADNPDMDAAEAKKIKAQTLAWARQETGADKRSAQVEITDKEWEAIQARALSSSKVQQILNNTDSDAFKQRAIPREEKLPSESNINKAMRMIAQGKDTIYEISNATGVSIDMIGQLAKEQGITTIGWQH